MRPSSLPLRGALRRLAAAAFAIAVVAGAATSATVGCSGWDPREPFERNAPEVDESIRELDAGRPEKAEEVLERYLGTGPCTDAGIGLPDAVRQKPNGSFDLGLTLFYLAERYGRRFGDEEQKESEPDDPQKVALRGGEIDCAMIIVKAIAADPSVPLELRARARYLTGNLEFLREKYEDAVKEYDQALALVPGLLEEAGGDGIGRDAAWNRALALRRIEDKKDAGEDGSDGADGSDGNDGADGADGADADDGAPDAGPDSPDGDDGNDGGGDAGDQPDGGRDGGEGDGGPSDAASDAPGDAAPADAGQQGPEPKEDPKGKNEPQPSPRQDDRILDQLEEAPTYQEQEAKNRAGVRRGRVLEDK